MAAPLTWKAGEGYDIHLLRDGPASKRLADALDLGDVKPDTVTFIPRGLVGTDFGVEIDARTGVVKASLHPDQSKPKVTNFLLEVLGSDAVGVQSQTQIRIHVHDGLDHIWLTPSSLTIHKDANECRFTVLAGFNEGVVGDITDWPQLSYKSIQLNTSPSVESADILVSPTGILTAVTPGKSALVTAEVKIFKESKPGEQLASLYEQTGHSLCKGKLGRDSRHCGDYLRYRRASAESDGTVLPNKDDPDSTKRDSVKSVVNNAVNILFIAEGFRQEQRGDFNNLIWKIVEKLRTEDSMLPFKLLKGSINYWSVFVPSEETGLTILGEYHEAGKIPHKERSWYFEPVPLPKKPDAAATLWLVDEIVDQVGLPTPNGPEPMDLHSIVEDYGSRFTGIM